MILSDTRILEEIQKGTIKIEPYDRKDLGSNSYDVHLGKWLATYDNAVLDAKAHNTISYFEIPDEGFVLEPTGFYLGVTLEYTETHAHVPFLEGKSSTGRLGIDIHATAGKGDVGFCGYWTLEISVKQPVRVYKGMPIGQLIYFPVDGEIRRRMRQPHHVRHDVTRTGDRSVRSELANHMCMSGIDTNFFIRFAKCGLQRRLPHLEPTARKCDLSFVGGQRVRASGQQHSGLAALCKQRHQHCRRM